MYRMDNWKLLLSKCIICISEQELLTHPKNCETKQLHLCNLFHWLTAVLILVSCVYVISSSKDCMRGYEQFSLCPADGSIASWEASLLWETFLVSPCRSFNHSQVKWGLFLGWGPDWQKLGEKKKEASSLRAVRRPALHFKRVGCG